MHCLLCRHVIFELKVHCAVPENIYTRHTEGIAISRGWGSVKQKNCKEMFEISRGVGSWKKSFLCGRMDIFGNYTLDLESSGSVLSPG